MIVTRDHQAQVSQRSDIEGSAIENIATSILIARARPPQVPEPAYRLTIQEPTRSATENANGIQTGSSRVNARDYLANHILVIVFTAVLLCSGFYSPVNRLIIRSCQYSVSILYRGLKDIEGRIPLAVQ